MSEKLKIIYRVHRKLQQQVSYNDYLSKACDYTGLRKKTLIKLEKSEIVNIKLDSYSVDRSLIYNTLCRFYMRYRVDGGKLPTTYDLYKALIKSGKIIYMDIASFRKLLKKMGFVWQQIEGQFPQSTVVVIENPLIRLEKINYLKRIRRCRAQNYDDVYFIGDVAFNQTTIVTAQESLTLEKFGNTLWEGRSIYAVGVRNVEASEMVEGFTASDIEDWVIEHLLPFLSRPSVIVVPHFERFKTKVIDNPNLYSPKVEIAGWLDYHNVPYDSDMSKYELYSLAEEYTDLETPIYKLDIIMKARGHSFLRMPKYLEELNPAAILFKTIKRNWNKLDGVLPETNYRQAPISSLEDIIRRVRHNLVYFTKTVIGMELKTVAQEMDVDLDMERLMVNCSSSDMASNILDSDVASCSDSE